MRTLEYSRCITRMHELLTFISILSYGRPTHVSKPAKPFATFFYQNFAKPILSAFMTAFKYRSSGGGYITERVAHKAFEYMEMS